MYNDLFSIGPITIHGYGLMIAIGFLAGVFLGDKKAQKKGMNADEIYYMSAICLIFGFLCGKLLFCAVEWKTLLTDPLSLLTMNGFVVYGGIVGGILAALIWCKARKLIFLDYFDVILPCVAVVQGFGRIGCFLAGCCYGKETDSPFSIYFTNSAFAPNHVKLIPTQLISSAGMFLIAIILFAYGRKHRARGSVGFLYLILYSIGRFGVEFLRGDLRGTIGPLSTSQFISIFILIAGVIGFIVTVKKGVPEEPEQAEETKPEEKKPEETKAEETKTEQTGAQAADE